jgi:hypothetical protein
MEDACIFRNVIEIFLAKKNNQGKKGEGHVALLGSK